MKPAAHPIINLILDGMAAALLGVLVLWMVNLAVNIWIRVRHELHQKKSARKVHEINIQAATSKHPRNSKNETSHEGDEP
jgi:hypothetical protein